ncbi:Alpha-mannosidase [Operophtera brumata]|uniref:Alpha-mannosidase n=1 Tax=Operophtera brumata TaxID=104452 RepID=A0A0L7LD82_OPEBR|nr:Alpha-mannosidase [Operophtera brumata]
MVQRPFSDTDGAQTFTWANSSILKQRRESQTNTVVHRMQRPKMSTILSSVETSRGKSSYDKTNPRFNELRLARNTFSNISVSPLHPFVIKLSNVVPRTNRSQSDGRSNNNISIDTHYALPTMSKFFPPLDEQELQSIEQKTNSRENTIIFPEAPDEKENKTIVIKGIFLANKSYSERSGKEKEPKSTLVDMETDSVAVDYFLQRTPIDVGSKYINNSSVHQYNCLTIKEAKTDIDAQAMFSKMDIEVILVPRTHVDSIWKKSFEQYHKESVSKILSNVVKKLLFYSNLTFTWNEVSHLSQWWKSTSQKCRNGFRKLVKSGRLEITTGGWVEPDEATTHLFGLVHQIVQGHEWLKHHLNYSPKVGWLTNTVSHSPTMAYLLSASDISYLVLTNLHYSWAEYLAEYQYGDFVWVQSWDGDRLVSSVLNEALNVLGRDRHPKNSVFTHYLQFNSASFKACGPNSGICANDFNFAKSNKNLDINPYNVKDKSELLLEQYSKTGTTTQHNVIIAPLGGPYRYESQSEFDYQYNNYQKLADFVNANREIYKATMEFGTPKDYFKSILKTHKNIKTNTIKGDFLNFADIDSGRPAYWTGYYTSRPTFKIMLRRLESTLRTTEILFSFAVSLNSFRGYNVSRILDKLVNARESVARLLDRNVASGTLPANVLKHINKLILATVNNCWHIQEVAASFLSSKPGQLEPHLHKYVYREGEFISTFRTVYANDQIYIFNSLSHENTEVVELLTRYSNIRIVDHNKKEITVQINPIWKYTSDKIQISRRFFKIFFAVVLPPMTLELFTIKETYDVTHSASAIFCSSCMVGDEVVSDSIFPFNIQPIQTGDIQLESYKHRLVFDEMTGFLKTVIEKETNIEKSVMIDFGAFRDASVNSGMFLFNTNISKPLKDILMLYRIGALVKATAIISGKITTEISSIYGHLLQHTIKIFNFIQNPLSNAIYVETKVDYELSPKNRELEFFMSIQTDISNGDPPQIVTDNNGFQHTIRILNMSRGIESNMYPATSMVYIQDRRSRLTYITDHAQGVTALHEGQLVIMLDRRVLFNDGRGTGEGLADSSTTRHRQYILFENFMDPSEPLDSESHDPKLPSLSAVYLANSLNYHLDIFLVDKNKTDQCHYAFLPLLKTSFPCDVSVINYRVILSKGGFQDHTPNTALLILHRRSISCKIATTISLHCNGESNFLLENILRNLKAVYQTNLAGTTKGIPLLNFTPVNFPQMELTTLRVYF